MPNERKICKLGIKNEYLKKSIQKVTTKALWDSKLYVAVDKILLIKQIVVSIKGQPFYDDMLFHLNCTRLSLSTSDASPFRCRQAFGRHIHLLTFFLWQWLSLTERR